MVHAAKSLRQQSEISRVCFHYDVLGECICFQPVCTGLLLYRISRGRGAKVTEVFETKMVVLYELCH